MRDFSADHRWLSINTATVRKQRGVEWPLLQILQACAERGIRAVAPWRDQVAAAGLRETSRRLRDLGLVLSGYCRGGMFPYTDAAGQQAARSDNLRALDEACELGAPCLVLVVGGLPGALGGQAAHKDITLARQQVSEGIAELLQAARERRMPLAIEPLHPMYAADRACINTLAQALDAVSYTHLWAYYKDSEVKLVASEGATDHYSWGPNTQKFIRCKSCGCVMQWKKHSVDDKTWTGVNARQFDPERLGDVRIRLLDGAQTWKVLG